MHFPNLFPWKWSGRKIGFCMIILIFLAGSVTLAILAPWQDSKTKELKLLQGDLTWTSEQPTYEVPLLIFYKNKKGTFVRLTGNDKLLAHVEATSLSYSITYDVEVRNQPIRHWTSTKGPLFYRAGQAPRIPEIRHDSAVFTYYPEWRDLFTSLGMLLAVCGLLSIVWLGITSPVDSSISPPSTCPQLC